MDECAAGATAARSERELVACAARIAGVDDRCRAGIVRKSPAPAAEKSPAQRAARGQAGGRGRGRRGYLEGRLRWNEGSPPRPHAGRLQQDVLLHRQGRAARLHLRGRHAAREGAQRRATRTARGRSASSSSPPAATSCCRRWPPATETSRPANLTITPERRELVDFSTPIADDVSEILVTAVGAPAPATAEGLSGAEVHVRQSSSYYSSLLALNERLKARARRRCGSYRPTRTSRTRTSSRW